MGGRHTGSLLQTSLNQPPIGLRRRLRDSVTKVERASLVASNILTDGSGKQKRATGEQLGLNEIEKC